MFPFVYLDIHRHAAIAAPQKDVLTLFNLYAGFLSASAEKCYSFGLHPWYITNLSTDMEGLTKAANAKNVKAIGECGLDAIKGGPFELQVAAFEAQIQLANNLDKPLIIHCVKAFPQVLSLLTKAHVPVVFHGFNKKLTVASEIIEKGYYLSFGAALLNPQTAASRVFAEIPLNRVFLETDAAEMDIRDIYKAASRIRKIEADAIILQVQENFKNVFNF